MNRSGRAPSLWYQSKLLVSAVLVAATVLAYSNVVDCDFVNLDDETYVAKNANVQAGLTGKSLAWAFATTQSANWQPLTWMSLQLDSELNTVKDERGNVIKDERGNIKLDAGGFHLTNALLHAAAGVLLMWTLTRGSWYGWLGW